MDLNPISADSHITEPPNCYLDYIRPVAKQLLNQGTENKLVSAV